MTTFLIALDGASPDLINKWIDKGELPNLAKIRSQGLSGKLETIFPPLTGPAWSSFQTGVNPGKHGIYSWLDLSRSYKGEVINSSSIKTRTVWDLISHKGGKVGLVSLPVTYPPEKVNGFVIPGFLTPSRKNHPGYPEEVAKSLFDAVPDFQYHPPFFPPNMAPRRWVDQLNSTIQTRGKAARFLYKNHLSNHDNDSSVFMVHFFATDQVQHKLWNYREDGWDPRLEVFREADSQIGQLIELAPDNSTFLVVSDHGFGPINMSFNVNNWLHQQDFLAFRKNFTSLAKKKLSDFGLTKERLKPIGGSLYPIANKLNLVDNFTTDPLTDDRLSTLFLSYKDVDWNRTRAYSRSDIGQIRLNLKGREGQGTIDEKSSREVRKEIMNKLKEVKIPGENRKLSEWVKTKEEVYHGPFLKHGPDILFNPLPNAVQGYGAIMFMSKKVFSLNPCLDPGHHRKDGILFAVGPTVTAGKKDAHITDIAPTLLNQLSFPIPEQMDGDLIREITPGEPKYSRPKDFYKTRVRTGESEESRKKLEGLGYL
ncbi:alkaline phosphatase family protein [Candidatus Bipolaricaulota bacterium]|nr:alkaline phosphatase family protein [Candidatus Bipolaricaulota bacterium]